MHVRNRFSARSRVTGKDLGVTRTKQSMAAGCDINVIMGRYLRSGQVDHLSKHGGSYGFADSQTFHEAMNTIRVAETMFLDLPSGLRKRFGNDPAAFLDFVQDKDNLEEMRKLGLAKPAPKAPADEPGVRFDDDGVVLEDQPADRPAVDPPRAPAGAPAGRPAPKGRSQFST